MENRTDVRNRNRRTAVGETILRVKFLYNNNLQKDFYERKSSRIVA